MLQEVEDPDVDIKKEFEIEGHEEEREEEEREGEEVPLPHDPPFPYKKVFIGAMIWFMDWFNGGSLGSFVGYMVLDFGLVTDPADVGYYSGFLSSTYFFSQFISSFWWGKLSDKKGRRPILLCGLIGALLSTVAFGFSTNFAFAIVARSLNGLLNSNSGVVKTYIGEITDSSNQARAFGYVSLVGGLGMVVGPMVGGYFAKPVEKYPKIFPPGSFFDKFPYLLPSLVSAVLNVILIILSYIYLTETRQTHYVGLKQTINDEEEEEEEKEEEEKEKKDTNAMHEELELKNTKGKDELETVILVTDNIKSSNTGLLEEDEFDGQSEGIKEKREERR